MHQYHCIKCNEPVSDEMEKPVLEDGIVIVCKQCLINWLLSFTEPVMIDITNYQEIDSIMANELKNQVITVKGD